MTGQALAAHLHYLSIFLLLALLGIEHVQFKLPLDLHRGRSLIITDSTYGICAGVVLFSGLCGQSALGKRLDFGLSNSLFDARVGLFILVGLISVVPSLAFVN